MKPTEFSSAEDDFIQWMREHPTGFYFHVKAKGRGMLHRVSCWHLGPLPRPDPLFVMTRRPKTCHENRQDLMTWARHHGIHLDACASCDP